MIDMASKHIAVWPKVRVFVKGGSKVVERGETLPSGVAQAELDNLVSFGAVAGVTEPSSASVPADEASGAPAKSASKAQWVEYAVTQGMSEEDANAATRDELAEKYSG